MRMGVAFPRFPQVCHLTGMSEHILWKKLWWGGMRRYIVERIAVISILIYFSNTLNAGYPHCAASFTKLSLWENKALAISAEMGI